MQTINAQIRHKYDKQFNFFFSKPISEIIFNRPYAEATLDYKDIAILCQSNQYLKRPYLIKNQAGRNQIYDRIRMLSDFYSGAAMLKYEYPMMIITQTKQVFLKRVKRLKKMIASDCSSQESESSQKDSSQFQQFSSSRFLRTIKSRELEQSRQSQNSLIKNCEKNERQYDDQVHSIFEFKKYEEEENQFEFVIKINDGDDLKTKFEDIKTSEFGLEHLILDLDDIDKDNITTQYKKMQEKENLTGKWLKDAEPRNSNMKKSSIIITPLDHYSPDNKYTEQKAQQQAHKAMKKQVGPRTYEQDYNNTAYKSSYSKNVNFRQPPNDRFPSFGVSKKMEEESEQKGRNSYQNFGLEFHQPSTEIKSISRINKYTVGYQHLQKSNQYNPGYHQYETAYFTQQNSLSNKAQKKQTVKEKAVALLNKIKSEQKLPISQDQYARQRYAGRYRVSRYD